MKSVKLTALTGAVALAGAMFATLPAAAETVGPVTDEVGVVKIASDGPIVIGAYLAMGGPESALGIDEKRAIEIAFDEIDWKISGHPIKLIIEDSQCNSEGGQTAATKLAANQRIVVVIGPSCSNAAMPGAPVLWKAGIPSIGLNSVPAITDPSRPPEYHGYLRTAFNDSFSALSDADWAYNVGNRRKAVLLHDGTAYSQSVAEYFGRAFEALGGSVLSIEAIGAQDVDMRPALTKIAAEGPDLIYLPLYVYAAGYVVRQAPEISGLENTVLLGQNALMTSDMITAAGDSIVGFKIALVDLSEGAFSEGYPAFIKTYVEKYGERPPQAFHYLAYDAALVAIAALNDVLVTDDAGTSYVGRMALRDRLYATKNLMGLSGSITCNDYGDCGVFHGAVYEFVDGDPATFSPGTNPIKIWP